MRRQGGYGTGVVRWKFYAKAFRQFAWRGCTEPRNNTMAANILYTFGRLGDKYRREGGIARFADSRAELGKLRKLSKANPLNAFHFCAEAAINFASFDGGQNGN